MLLSDYQWSHNPRGLHNRDVYDHYMDVGRYLVPQMGWAKLVCAGAEYHNQVIEMLDNDVTPIIRIWRGFIGGTRPDEGMYEAWRHYLDLGVKWFELFNEPNQNIEWPDSHLPDPDDIENAIAPIMETWIDWAEWLIGMGGYPGFPALAETAEPGVSSIKWAENFIRYLAERHYDRFTYVINNGLWFATHPYLLNHFYQEMPGGNPLHARPPDQQRADEDGWHFEYPYDPICQANDPGRTVWGGTELAPTGDPNGLIAMGIVLQDLLKRYFNAGPVPVVGTEGGIWPIPAPGEPPEMYAPDNRYPGYTRESHAEATLAMFEWIVTQGPPWMFGVACWKEDLYYEDPHGEVPAIRRLAETPPLYKNVLPIDTASGQGSGYEGIVTAVETGPGPIHGMPDFHFLLLAPGLSTDWLFEAAARYWQAFRPAIMPHPGFIRYIPYSRSLAVTVIARPNDLPAVESMIRDAWPNVLYDPVVGESPEAIAAILDARVTQQRRFGAAWPY